MVLLPVLPAGSVAGWLRKIPRSESHSLSGNAPHVRHAQPYGFNPTSALVPNALAGNTDRELSLSSVSSAGEEDG